MTGIGLLGCGAMGAEIARAISAGEAGGATLAALFDQQPGLALTLAESLDAPALAMESFDRFLSAPDVDMVVEAPLPTSCAPMPSRCCPAAGTCSS